ncbi:MAG: hypothetical protein ACE5NM_09990 [Sedimentisphaerales bacterium]
MSVQKWNGGLLPYADNLVNLVISDNLDSVSMDEIMRVLRPLGVSRIEHCVLRIENPESRQVICDK